MKTNNTNIADTPTKRIKPNEDSTLDRSKLNKPPKTSLFQKMMSGSIGSRKDKVSPMSQQVSQFLPLFDFKSSSSKDSNKMEQENYDLEKQVKGFLLNRKLTCQNQQSKENEEILETLNLYRSNSTFDQMRTIKDIKLGDNIYLRQINSKSQVIPDKRTKQHEEHGSRIQQDYQIQHNLKLHGKHHQNYICLNKLERIFYYVKKMNMSWESNQGYQFIHNLASNQIKLYNKDQNGYLMRFYQSWFQHNALYLTYEVAIESLEDCTRAHNRLKEVEAWDLLRDTTQALHWMSSQMGVYHLNIKPGNILKSQKKYKLADPYIDPLILQAYLKKQESNWNGWSYLAPQIRYFSSLMQGLDLKQCDIYSLGMSLIQNLLGDRYFPRDGKAMRLHLQKHLHSYSPALMKTLMRMVSLDPQKRPKAQQLCDIGRKQKEEKVTHRRKLSM